jgi:hypothetical protein
MPIGHPMKIYQPAGKLPNKILKGSDFFRCVIILRLLETLIMMDLTLFYS